MGRPRTGSLKDCGDGRWTVTLIREPGSTRTVQRTFRSREAACRWRDAGLSALDAGRPLPDAGPYQRTGAIQAVDKRPGAAPDLEEWCYRWHHSYYEENEKASPGRAQDAKADIRNHILPVLRALGALTIADVGYQMCVHLARHLAGRPVADRHWVTVPPPSPELMQSTSANVFGVLRKICERAVAEGYLRVNPAADASAMKGPADDAAAPDIEQQIPLRVVRMIAAKMSHVHQLVLWLCRLAGLRLSEAFGVRVEDVSDFGEYGTITVRRQGGRNFLVREAEAVVRVSEKEDLKTHASKRLVVIPTMLLEIIKVIIEAYHTDPSTGEVDSEARLIPGIQHKDRAGQSTYRDHFTRATDELAQEGVALADGLSPDLLTPHDMRAAFATDLAWDKDVGERTKRRAIGHRVGKDVLARDYTLDPETHALVLPAVRNAEQRLRAELADLIVPSAVQHEWGKDNPIRSRLAVVEAVLAAHGWLADDHDDGEWLDAYAVAERAGIHHSTAREKMRTGVIRASRFKWGTRDVWHSRRQDVEQWVAERDGTPTLDDIAAECGLSYHRAYETLKRLGMHPELCPGGTGLQVTEEHRMALVAEVERVQQLCQRSMRIAQAAVVLNRNPRTVRGYVQDGQLELDDETDSSGARFVTRASVEELMPGGSGPPASVSLREAACRHGLPIRAVHDLIRDGTLEGVRSGRSLRVTESSLALWSEVES